VKIEIKKYLNKEEFEIFRGLIEKTAKRDNFTIFSKIYYEKLLHIFALSSPEFASSEMPRTKIFLAEFHNEIIAVAIVIFYDKTATYLHGASDYNFRKVMAPHLLQWGIISDAKKSGFRYYDFWGINENRWPGVTRFKKGFNGKEIEYAGTWDYVFKPFWYQMYNMGQRIKNSL
ncbi:MAG: peptidoglycan bridge formation glycyltransferase FemA/FemB family protein, partial [Patescibacteria group bacterium]